MEGEKGARKPPKAKAAESDHLDDDASPAGDEPGWFTREADARRVARARRAAPKLAPAIRSVLQGGEGMLLGAIRARAIDDGFAAPDVDAWIAGYPRLAQCPGNPFDPKSAETGLDTAANSLALLISYLLPDLPDLSHPAIQGALGLAFVGYVYSSGVKAFSQTHPAGERIAVEAATP